MQKFVQGVCAFALVVTGVGLFSWRAAFIAAGAVLIFDNVT